MFPSGALAIIVLLRSYRAHIDYDILYRDAVSRDKLFTYWAWPGTVGLLFFRASFYQHVCEVAFKSNQVQAVLQVLAGMSVYLLPFMLHECTV